MPQTDSAGVPIHFEVIGHGPSIVLVHGFASNLESNWRRTGWIDFLVEQGHQVIGLDCRGHGSSGKPHTSAAYAGHQVPDDVITVMNAAGVDRAAIMGYSMGGWITLDLIIRYADRFSSAVVGGSGLRSALADPGRRAAIADALDAQDVSAIADPTARTFRQFAEGRGNDLQALAALQRTDRPPLDEPALGRLALPLLAVVGDKDEALQAVQLLARTVPKSELVVLPGEDHLSAVTATGYKDAVNAFLRQPSAVGS
jgi:pimeloyl-ACP methyl ester carboxylesterase